MLNYQRVCDFSPLDPRRRVAIDPQSHPKQIGSKLGFRDLKLETTEKTIVLASATMCRAKAQVNFASIDADP